MDEPSLEKIVDDTLGSFDEIKRAEPKPFLLMRVMAAVNNDCSAPGIWTRTAVFISRPGIAIAGLILFIFVNITIFFISKQNRGQPGITQNSVTARDEFAINAASIYDIDNPE
ncbi:MAG: hypothetical protein ABIT58_09945 [Ferruginibacter sp.]